MFTKNGTIIFSKFKKLMKRYGGETSTDIAFEAIRRMEKSGYIGPNSHRTNRQIEVEANRVISEIEKERFS